MTELTQDYIKSFLHYDPDTGALRRTKKRTCKGNFVDCDTASTSVTSYGYVQINIDARPRLVHRLAFLYMTGQEPVEDVDHINGDRLDNRWSNLRLVDRQTNLRNAGVRSDNTSGQPGVSYAKDRKKWHAYINSDKGRRTSLGHFDTHEEAVVARVSAERMIGYHPNHGRRDGWRG